MRQLSKVLLASTILGGAAMLAAPAQALVIDKTNSSAAIVDASSTTRDVSVGAGDLAGSSGVITKVTITIDFSKCGESGGSATTDGCATSDFGTPFFNEIVFSLTGPSAPVVSLIAAGTFGTGFTSGRFEMTFDDSGAALGAFPADGTFDPVGSLADFIGLNALGTWSLFIGDTVGADPLVFHDYTLSITVEDPEVEPPTDAPEPASGAALLAGLAALWAGRRARNA